MLDFLRRRSASNGGAVAAPVEAGLKELRAGNLDRAERIFRQALEAGHESTELFHALGELFWARKKFAEAAGCFNKAHQLAPDRAETIARLGDSLLRLGKLQQAVDEYRKAVSLDPKSVQVPGRRSLYGDALSDRVVVGLSNCDWANLARDEAELLDAIRHRAACMRPYISLFVSASSSDQFACARNQWSSLALPAPAGLPMPPRDRSARIKLGYVAGTYYRHATARLISELFELHDRSRFEITA